MDEEESQEQSKSQMYLSDLGFDIVHHIASISFSDFKWWFPKVSAQRILFSVAPAAQQSDLSSGFSVCLLACLAVDKEFHFKYCY